MPVLTPNFPENAAAFQGCRSSTPSTCSLARVGEPAASCVSPPGDCGNFADPPRVGEPDGARPGEPRRRASGASVR